MRTLTIRSTCSQDAYLNAIPRPCLAQSGYMTNGWKWWNFDQKERSTLTLRVHLSSSSFVRSRTVHRMLRNLRPLATRLSLGRRMSSALAPPSIQLTPEEARFCDLLDDFAREGRKRITKPAVEVEIPEVQCRIAGGWVRDKVRFEEFPLRLLLTDGIHSFLVCHRQTSISPFQHAQAIHSPLPLPSI